MRHRRPLAAVLLACAAVAAGCGDGAEKDNAYVDAVSTAQRSYANRFEQVSERLTVTSTVEQDRATLADMAAATQTFVASLKGIDPPEEVREEHARLTTSAAGYARKVTEARAGLVRDTAADRGKVRSALSSDVENTQEQVVKAIAEINAGLQG